jgi:putative transcriptional regulator
MYGIAYIMTRVERGRPMKLLNHIKQHRARLDLTQQELAERIGVRRQTIIAIEKRQYVPSALLAFLIARELGMAVDDLFELVDENGGANHEE